ncbi:DUF2513 domain-containing protein [Listeria monocytogenes]|nr:DUF2513 domain-containing protein [Listeria monocytogenes]EAK8454130.1 DUF2513 domain-containing protein [Listeria monocytogenes]EAV9986005.1 DUF2513 domain-containing protein [Listeria monocytogenes]EHD1675832.1 DUF2513 domain-containing protein [Listeria monocytogenes]EHJ4882851.1 DUF2513 domain-containing protein [Listeria monocytogenes]
MKINYDCIRDVLLSVRDQEEYGDLHSDFFTESLGDKYSFHELANAVSIILYEGLAVGAYPTGNMDGNYDYIIRFLTVSGDQFINSVKDDSVWSKAKEEVKNNPIQTLFSFAQIAVSFFR